MPAQSSTAIAVLRPLLLGAAALGAGYGMALAHGSGPMPPVFLQRHAVMTSLAVHLKAAKAAVAAGDMKAVADQAEAIH